MKEALCVCSLGGLIDSGVAAPRRCPSPSSPFFGHVEEITRRLPLKLVLLSSLYSCTQGRETNLPRSASSASEASLASLRPRESVASASRLPVCPCPSLHVFCSPMKKSSMQQRLPRRRTPLRSSISPSLPFCPSSEFWHKSSRALGKSPLHPLFNVAISESASACFLRVDRRGSSKVAERVLPSATRLLISVSSLTRDSPPSCPPLPILPSPLTLRVNMPARL